MDKWTDYSRNIYDLVSSMQKEVTSVLESQYSSFTKNASSAVERPAPAPRRRRRFAAAMKSMLNASTKAFDNMTSMAKQLSDIAEANMQVATKAPKTSATAAAAEEEQVSLSLRARRKPGCGRVSHRVRGQVAPDPSDAAPLHLDANVLHGAIDQTGSPSTPIPDGDARLPNRWRQRKEPQRRVGDDAFHEVEERALVGRRPGQGRPFDLAPPAGTDPCRRCRAPISIIG